jgi:hypothetical protein
MKTATETPAGELSAYELERLANIRRNEAVLAALEIPDLAKEAAAARAEKRKEMMMRKAQRALHKPREPRNQQRRSSGRVAGKPALYVPSMDDGISVVVKKARAQYLELPSRPRGGKKKAPLEPLTESTRLALADAEDWLEDFHDFLEHTLGDSEQNRRQAPHSPSPHSPRRQHHSE